ncbi:MAG: hypothetical protein AAF492_12470, partial [Verrucomicrobiota bacterium]
DASSSIDSGGGVTIQGTELLPGRHGIGNDTAVLIEGSITAVEDIVVRGSNLVSGTLMVHGQVASLGANVGFEGNGDVDLSADVIADDKIYFMVPGHVIQNAGHVEAATLAFHVGGDLILTSMMNDVNEVAGEAGGRIDFVDVDDLRIGSVMGMDGLVTSDSRIDVEANSLVVANQVNAGTSTSRWTVTSGGVTQIAGRVTAGELEIDSAGSVLQAGTGELSVGDLRFDADSDVVFPNLANSIGTVAGTSSVGSITIVASNPSTSVGPLLTMDQPINVTGGALNLVGSLDAGNAGVNLNTSSGGILQQAGSILSSSLSFDSAGFVNIGDPGNTFSVVGGMSMGSITLANDRDLSLGFPVGLDSGNSDVVIRSSGNFNVPAPLRSGTGRTTLDIAGNISQSPFGIIDAVEFIFDSQTGSVILDSSNNQLDVVAGEAAGPVELSADTSFGVGMLDLYDGIESGGSISFSTLTFFATSPIEALNGDDIRFVADELVFSGPPDSISTMGGEIEIRQINNGRDITFGGPDTPGSLSLSSAEIDTLADGASLIRVGDADAGSIRIGDATVHDDLEITGRDIEFAGHLNAGTEDVTLNSGGAVFNSHLSTDVTADALVINTESGIELITDVNSAYLGVADNGDISFLNLSDLTLSNATVANEGMISVVVRGDLMNVGTVRNDGTNSILLFSIGDLMNQGD